MTYETIDTLTLWNNQETVSRLESAIQTIHTSFNDPTWNEDTEIIKDRYLGEDTPDGTVIQVAKLGSEIIGYVIANFCEERPDTSVVAFLAISQNHQHNGLGTQLLANVAAMIQAQGMTYLRISCEAKNVPFYTKFADRSHYKVLQNKKVGTYRFKIGTDTREVDKYGLLINLEKKS